MFTFDRIILDLQVFPHVATGFSDTSSLLRELTLKSMLVLAPKVSCTYFHVGPKFYLTRSTILGLVHLKILEL